MVEQAPIGEADFCHRQVRYTVLVGLADGAVVGAESHGTVLGIQQASGGGLKAGGATHKTGLASLPIADATGKTPRAA